MLVVRKSRIPNAGRGLFTTSPIRKGDVIVEYLGDKLTWKQVLQRYKHNLDEVRYVFCITDDNCIDAKPRKEELAQYANDANGGGKKNNPFRNNCEYSIIKKRPYIVAKKNIPANAEILVDYGDEYWEAIRENEETERKKREKKAAGKKGGSKKGSGGAKKGAGKKAAGGKKGAGKKAGKKAKRK
jgi:SET domain-containing protein